MTFVPVPVAGFAPAPKFHEVVWILSGATILDVLFNNTLEFKQAFTGVNVAVGKAFTLTPTLVVLTQPLLVVAVKTAVKLPDAV